jgi:hypothetical protein
VFLNNLKAIKCRKLFLELQVRFIVGINFRNEGSTALGNTSLPSRVPRSAVSDVTVEWICFSKIYGTGDLVSAITCWFLMKAIHDDVPIG